MKCVLFKDTGLFKSCMIFLIGVELPCNVVLVSAVQQSELLISSIQSLSHVQFFVTLWTAAHQASLSITNSGSLLKLMSIELVMPSNHFILPSPSPPAFNLSQHQGLFQ